MADGTLVLHVDQTGDVMDENISQAPSDDKESEQQALIHTSHLESKQTTPLYVYFLTVFAAIGGFLFGYDTGVISGAMILIKEEFDLSSFWQELIVSATIGAAILGALLGGFLNQWLGRKPLLVASAMVFTVGAVVMGVAQSREILLVGRLTVGFGIGEFDQALRTGLLLSTNWRELLRSAASFEANYQGKVTLGKHVIYADL